MCLVVQQECVSLVCIYLIVWAQVRVDVCFCVSTFVQRIVRVYLYANICVQEHAYV